jgi:hypothetical protein
MSTVRKAQGGDEALGVVSTHPGILLGGNTAHGVPVAFSGRVPVLVTNENGDVHQGDYLVLSTSTPGYAMRATESGYTIGRALSDASSTLATTTVLMVVENKHHTVTLSSVEGLSAYATSSESFTEPTKTVYDTLLDSLVRGNTLAVNYLSLTTKAVAGYFDRVFAREVYTDKVCIKKSDGTNVCLTGDQVEGMLNATQIPLLTPSNTTSSGGQPTSTTTEPTTSSSTSSGGVDTGSSTPSTQTGDATSTSTETSSSGVGGETPPALNPDTSVPPQVPPDSTTTP